jgi:hypothetical protein
VGSLVAVVKRFLQYPRVVATLSEYPRRNWRRGSQRYYLADPGSPKPLTPGCKSERAWHYHRNGIPPRCQVSLRCFRAAKYLVERFTSGR